MKIKVIGIKEVDYFSKKKNEQVTGREVHYEDIGTQRNGLTGHQVGTVYIGSKNPAYKFFLEVGGTYTIYLDGYAVDYLAPYDGEDEFDM